jgi:hypothetical protein
MAALEDDPSLQPKTVLVVQSLKTSSGFSLSAGSTVGVKDITQDGVRFQDDQGGSRMPLASTDAAQRIMDNAARKAAEIQHQEQLKEAQEQLHQDEDHIAELANAVSAIERDEAPEREAQEGLRQHMYMEALDALREARTPYELQMAYRAAEELNKQDRSESKEHAQARQKLEGATSDFQEKYGMSVEKAEELEKESLAHPVQEEASSAANVASQPSTIPSQEAVSPETAMGRQSLAELQRLRNERARQELEAITQQLDKVSDEKAQGLASAASEAEVASLQDRIKDELKPIGNRLLLVQTPAGDEAVYTKLSTRVAQLSEGEFAEKQSELVQQRHERLVEAAQAEARAKFWGDEIPAADATLRKCRAFLGQTLGQDSILMIAADFLRAAENNLPVDAARDPQFVQLQRRAEEMRDLLKDPKERRSLEEVAPSIFQRAPNAIPART